MRLESVGIPAAFVLASLLTLYHPNVAENALIVGCVSLGSPMAAIVGMALLVFSPVSATTPCAGNPCLNGATCSWVCQMDNVKVQLKNSWIDDWYHEREDLRPKVCVSYTPSGISSCKWAREIEDTNWPNWSSDAALSFSAIDVGASSEYATWCNGLFLRVQVTGYQCDSSCDENLGTATMYAQKPSSALKFTRPRFYVNSEVTVTGKYSYKCICDDGFDGDHCETNINDCSPNPCQNNAVCVDLVDNYRCNCKAGYTGINCESEIDECASSPCPIGNACHDKINRYECVCAADYYKVDGSGPCVFCKWYAFTGVSRADQCLCPTGYSRYSEDASHSCGILTFYKGATTQIFGYSIALAYSTTMTDAKLVTTPLPMDAGEAPEAIKTELTSTEVVHLGSQPGSRYLVHTEWTAAGKADQSVPFTVTSTCNCDMRKSVDCISDDGYTGMYRNYHVPSFTFEEGATGPCVRPSLSAILSTEITSKAEGMGSTSTAVTPYTGSSSILVSSGAYSSTFSVSINTNRYLCLAYRTTSNLWRAELSYTASGTSKTANVAFTLAPQLVPQAYLVIFGDLTLDGEWHHGCINFYDQLRQYHSSSTTLVATKLRFVTTASAPANHLLYLDDLVFANGPLLASHDQPICQQLCERRTDLVNFKFTSSSHGNSAGLGGGTVSVLTSSSSGFNSNGYLAITHSGILRPSSLSWNIETHPYLCFAMKTVTAGTRVNLFLHHGYSTTGGASVQTMVRLFDTDSVAPASVTYTINYPGFDLSQNWQFGCIEPRRVKGVSALGPVQMISFTAGDDTAVFHIDSLIISQTTVRSNQVNTPFHCPAQCIRDGAALTVAPCADVSDCNAAATTTDPTGTPQDFAVRQDSGHMIFAWTDKSWCEAGFHVLRYEGALLVEQTHIAQPRSFSPTYIVESRCQEEHSPELELRDNIEESGLAVGTVHTYCIQAVSPSGYPVETGLFVPLASGPGYHSNSVCKSATVAFESKITVKVTHGANTGFFPVKDVVVRWHAVNDASLAGMGVTNAAGKFVVHPMSTSFPDNSVEIVVSVSKQQGTLAHEFECAGVPCTEKKLTFTHFDFDEESTFIDVSVMSVRGVVGFPIEDSSAGSSRRRDAIENTSSAAAVVVADPGHDDSMYAAVAARERIPRAVVVRSEPRPRALTRHEYLNFHDLRRRDTTTPPELAGAIPLGTIYSSLKRRTLANCVTLATGDSEAIAWQYNNATQECTIFSQVHVFQTAPVQLSSSLYAGCTPKANNAPVCVQACAPGFVGRNCGTSLRQSHATLTSASSTCGTPEVLALDTMEDIETCAALCERSTSCYAWSFSHVSRLCELYAPSLFNCTVRRAQSDATFSCSLTFAAASAANLEWCMSTVRLAAPPVYGNVTVTYTTGTHPLSVVPQSQSSSEYTYVDRFNSATGMADWTMPLGAPSGTTVATLDVSSSAYSGDASLRVTRTSAALKTFTGAHVLDFASKEFLCLSVRMKAGTRPGRIILESNDQPGTRFFIELSTTADVAAKQSSTDTLVARWPNFEQLADDTWHVTCLDMYRALSTAGSVASSGLVRSLEIQPYDSTLSGVTQAMWIDDVFLSSLDQSYVSAGACALLCDTVGRYMSWVHDNGVCLLYNVLPTSYSRHAGNGVRAACSVEGGSATQCQQLLLSNTLYNGARSVYAKATSPNACSLECDETIECTAWSYTPPTLSNSDPLTCLLQLGTDQFTEVGGIVYHATSVSGCASRQANEPMCRQRGCAPGYTGLLCDERFEYVNTLFTKTGASHVTAISAHACLLQCESMSTCTAWSWASDLGGLPCRLHLSDHWTVSAGGVSYHTGGVSACSKTFASTHVTDCTLRPPCPLGKTRDASGTACTVTVSSQNTVFVSSNSLWSPSKTAAACRSTCASLGECLAWTFCPLCNSTNQCELHVNGTSLRASLPTASIGAISECTRTGWAAYADACSLCAPGFGGVLCDQRLALANTEAADVSFATTASGANTWEECVWACDIMGSACPSWTFASGVCYLHGTFAALRRTFFLRTSSWSGCSRAGYDTHGSVCLSRPSASTTVSPKAQSRVLGTLLGGGTSTVSSAVACATLCDRNSACMAWAHESATCKQYASVLLLEQTAVVSSSSAGCSQRINSTACWASCAPGKFGGLCGANLARNETEWYVDGHTGTAVADKDTCIRSCSDQTTCVAWAYRSATQYCTLFTEVQKNSTAFHKFIHEDTVSGCSPVFATQNGGANRPWCVADAPAPAPVHANATVSYVGTAPAATTLQSSSVRDCLQECDRRTSCAAWSFANATAECSLFTGSFTRLVHRTDATGGCSQRAAAQAKCWATPVCAIGFTGASCDIRTFLDNTQWDTTESSPTVVTLVNNTALACARECEFHQANCNAWTWKFETSSCVIHRETAFSATYAASGNAEQISGCSSAFATVDPQRQCFKKAIPPLVATPKRCPIAGVKVCGRSFYGTREGFFCDVSDAEGLYTLHLPIEQRVYIELSYNNHTFEATATSDSPTGTGVPGDPNLSSLLDDLSPPITPYYDLGTADMLIDFDDVTKRSLNVTVGGGLCDRVLGTARLLLTRPSCPLLQSTIHMSDSTESLELPAHAFELRMMEIYERPEVAPYLDRTNQRLSFFDLTTSPGSALFRFHPRPTISIEYAGSSVKEYTDCAATRLDGIAPVTMLANKAFNVTVHVKEDFGDSTCGLLGGSVFLLNELTDKEQDHCLGGCDLSFDKSSLDGTAELRREFEAGLPEVSPGLVDAAHPYSRRLVVSYEVPGWTTVVGANFQVSRVIVTGARPLSELLSVQLPDYYPLMVVYDPPGGLSTATYSNAKVRTLMTVDQGHHERTVMGSSYFHAGYNLATESCNGVGSSVCTDTMGSEQSGLVGFTAGGSHTWWEDTPGEGDDSSALEFTFSMTTSDDPASAGSPSDRYLVPSLDLKYSEAELIVFNEETCRATKHSLITFDVSASRSKDENLAMAWVSGYDITSRLVPVLETLKASAIKAVLEGEDRAKDVQETGKAIANWNKIIKRSNDLRDNALTQCEPLSTATTIKQVTDDKLQTYTEGLASLAPSELRGQAHSIGGSLSGEPDGMSPGKYDGTIIFTGGGSTYTVSVATTEENTRSYDSGLSVEEGGSLTGDVLIHPGPVHVDFGVEVGSSTVENSGTIDMSTETITATVEATFGDPDVGDSFSVVVCRDPHYGTAYYQTLRGQSRGPHEPHTEAREKYRMQLMSWPLSPLMPTDTAVYTVALTNDSPTRETFTVDLSVETVTNVDGLEITMEGANLAAQPLSFDLSPGTKTVVMEVRRGPIKYEYEPVEFHLESQLDASFEYNPEPNEFVLTTLEVQTSFMELCPAVSFAGYLKDDLRFTVDVANKEVGDFQGEHRDEVRVLAFHPGYIIGSWTDDERLEKVQVQYRRKGVTLWSLCRDASGNELSLGDVETESGYATAYWDVSKLQDGEYDMRLRTQCKPAATDAPPPGMNEQFSVVLPGVFDRKAPEVFGKFAEPADGEYAPGDYISVTFDEPLRCTQPYTFSVLATVSSITPPLSTLQLKSSVKQIKVNCDGRVLSFEFGADAVGVLWEDVAGKRVTMQLQGVEDAVGNPMSTEQFVEWEFVTKPVDLTTALVHVKGLVMRRSVPEGGEGHVAKAIRGEVARVLGVDPARVSMPVVRRESDGTAAVSLQLLAGEGGVAVAVDGREQSTCTRLAEQLLAIIRSQNGTAATLDSAYPWLSTLVESDSLMMELEEPHLAGVLVRPGAPVGAGNVVVKSHGASSDHFVVGVAASALTVIVVAAIICFTVFAVMRRRSSSILGSKTSLDDDGASVALLQHAEW